MKSFRMTSDELGMLLIMGYATHLKWVIKSIGSGYVAVKTEDGVVHLGEIDLLTGKVERLTLAL